MPQRVRQPRHGPQRCQLIGFTDDKVFEGKFTGFDREVGFATIPLQ